MSTINEDIFRKIIKPGATLRCAICLGILDNPHRLPCSHTFCMACISSMDRVNKMECPMDRKEFKMAHIELDRTIREIISELDVFCTFKKEGCAWEGEFQQLEQHHKSCDYETEDCTLCNTSIVRTMMADHILSCPLRSVQCTSCYTWSGAYRLLDSHLKACGDAIISCPLSKYGCTFMGTRAKLNEHLNQQLINHFTDLVKQLEISRQREQSLEQQLAELSSSVASLSSSSSSSSSSAPPSPLLPLAPSVEKLREINYQTHSKFCHASPLIHRLLQSAAKVVTNNIPQITVSTVKQLIQIAIFGDQSSWGGAKLYDGGKPQTCLDIYVAFSDMLIYVATECILWPIDAKRIIEILKEGLKQANATNSPLGTRGDAAWKLRDAFEAVKRMSS